MTQYTIRHPEQIVTPALIYYRELFQKNTDAIIRLAGGADRLWPHVKTHKCIEMVRFQIRRGIRRFKCATVAELEMVCEAGAEAAILAMPPSGPTPQRIAALRQAYPQVDIYGIVDCEAHLSAYSDAARKHRTEIPLLLDVNMGMDRTGIPTDQAAAFYKRAAAVPGLRLCGLHCYDGNRHEKDLQERQRCVDRDDAGVFAVRRQLQAEGYCVEYMVLGGSPSFPCHVRHYEEGVYYSPGTIFLNDMGYLASFPDLPMVPAAAILCRVISHPAPGRFTLDLGYKGIAGDPAMDKRGTVFGLEHCHPVLQSEEYYVFQMDQGFEEQAPDIGTELYVVPYHVCPCAALYPSVLIAENGEITGEWEVTARNRKIHF